MSPLRIGMIGLDTSHCEAFASLLHEEGHPHHIPGARIAAAFPGGSQAFSLSRNRVAGVTETMQKKHGVQIRDSIEAVAADADAFLLESVDGRQHLAQFAVLAPLRKPVFIDKPLACSSADARAIADLAARHGTPVLSASAIRFAAGASGLAEPAAVRACEAFGPMSILDDYPGYFWYGIHSADLLFSYMGRGCREVTAIHQKEADVLVGKWSDGRIGTVRGLQYAGAPVGATVFTEKGTRHSTTLGEPPPYALLLQKVIPFLQTGVSPIDIAETVQVMEFLDAAGQSLAAGGKPVALP